MLSRLARTANSKGGATIDCRYYVQVHYPRGRQWVTVAMAETRETAAKVAANAFFGLRNGRGDTPRTCRVASGAQLVREGGQREIRHADAEIARRPRFTLDALRQIPGWGGRTTTKRDPFGPAGRR